MKPGGLILVTRPWAQAEKFADKLIAEGFEILLEPMLEIQPVDFNLPDLGQYDGLIFTSAHGVRCFGGFSAEDFDIPVYCVGARTAEMATERGFGSVLSADAAIEELAELVKSQAEAGVKLLYVCGAEVARPLEEMLPGFEVENCVVYEAVQQTEFSKKCFEALLLDKVQAVTFFSKRTAEAFMRIAEDLNVLESLKGIKALSISDAVLECVQTHLWEKTYVADAPNEDAMFALTRDVCVEYKQQDEAS